MAKKSFIALFLLLAILPARSQDFDLYEKFQFIQGGDTLPYRILLPENYDASKKYPLVFFLHGRGESGNDNQKQLVHGAALFLRDSIRKKYPAIVVFPQCSAHNYWSNVQTIADKSSKRSFYFIPDGEPSVSMRLAMGLLDNILLRYPVDSKRIYAMGLSMGGMGVFEIVRRKPGIFAAAVPICGGAHPATAKQMKKTAWWVFHGAKDDVVLPVYSENMVAALKAAGAKVNFTLYPNANHNSWDSAFAEPGLPAWLFAQHK